MRALGILNCVENAAGWRNCEYSENRKKKKKSHNRELTKTMCVLD